MKQNKFSHLRLTYCLREIVKEKSVHFGIEYIDTPYINTFVDEVDIFLNSDLEPKAEKIVASTLRF